MLQVEVSFDVDANGILNVTASEKSSGKKEKVKITNEESRLSAEEIAKMVKNAENFKKDDEIRKKRIEAKNSFQQLCDKVKKTFEDEEKKLNGKPGLETDRKVIYQKCEEGIDWVSKYKQNNLQEDDFKKREDEFKAFFDPIITKYGLDLDVVVHGHSHGHSHVHGHGHGHGHGHRHGHGHGDGHGDGHGHGHGNKEEHGHGNEEENGHENHHGPDSKKQRIH